MWGLVLHILVIARVGACIDFLKNEMDCYCDAYYSCLGFLLMHSTYIMTLEKMAFNPDSSSGK